jgi:hypothetical protein
MPQRQVTQVFRIQNDCGEDHLLSLSQIQAGDTQETCEDWSQERQQDAAAVPLLCQMLEFGPSLSGGTSAQSGQGRRDSVPVCQAGLFAPVLWIH